MGSTLQRIISGGLLVAIVATGAVWAAMPVSKPKAETLIISQADIRRVYDGDTFYINVPGVPAVFGKNIGVRILGIDTPEVRSHCKTAEQKVNEKKLALDAKDSLTSKLRSAKVIELTELKRDKYFRLLATVKVDGKDVAKSMIAEGYALPYDGGKKSSWCN